MPQEEDQFTSYRSLVSPRDEKDPWWDDYRRNINKIDSELVPQGPTSERPSDAPDDSLWYSTDRELLTRFDGGAGEWVSPDPERVENVLDYGAEGDGETDDTTAIQEAIDAVQGQDNARVFCPGWHYITRQLDISDSVTILGNGRFTSGFIPHYTSDPSNGRVSDLFWISDTTTVEDVAFRNFGVVGTEAAKDDYQTNGTIESPYARISFRDARHVTIENLFCRWGKNLIDFRPVRGFQADGLYMNEGSLPIHIAGGSSNGTVSNIVGDRVSTVMDFGGGVSDISVSNLTGIQNDYEKEEALDMGGAKNVSVSNAAFYGFPRAALIKGEEGADWDNVLLSNITATGITVGAIYATVGSEAGPISDLTIENCWFVGDPTVSGVRGVETNAAVEDVTFSNLHVHTTGHALNLNGASNVQVLGGEYRSDEAEAIVGSSAVIDLADVFIGGGVKCWSSAAQGDAHAIDLGGARGQMGVTFGKTIVKEASGGYGVNLSNCKRPHLDSVDINDTYSDGIRIRLTSTNAVDTIRDKLDVEVSNCSVRNFGLGNSGRNGIQIAVDLTLDNPRPFSQIRVEHNDVETRDEYDTNDHTGINFNVGGDVTGLNDVFHEYNRYIDVATGISGSGNFETPFENDPNHVVLNGN